MVHVQLTAGLREALDILKKRYGVDSQWKALEKFISDHDEVTLRTGYQIAELKEATAEPKQAKPKKDKK